jgi:hypothetical protein
MKDERFFTHPFPAFPLPLYCLLTCLFYFSLAYFRCEEVTPSRRLLQSARETKALSNIHTARTDMHMCLIFLEITHALWVGVLSQGKTDALGHNGISKGGVTKGGWRMGMMQLRGNNGEFRLGRAVQLVAGHEA